MLLRELLLQYEIENDKTHAEVAKEVGVSLSTYYRWLGGESTHLKVRTVQRLSEVLRYDMSQVVEENSRIKPILGQVKAGYDYFAQEDIEGFIELGTADAQKGDYFLRITGDSMEGSHIYDGDLVYVQQCDCVPSGKIAIVLIGDEATIKKVYYKKDLMILEASNAKYDSRFFTKEEVEQLPVRILGLVRYVRRDL